MIKGRIIKYIEYNGARKGLFAPFVFYIPVYVCFTYFYWRSYKYL